MWIVTYGSFAYFLSLIIPVLIIIGMYFLLRKKSEKTQKIVIFTLIMVNFIQHVFKHIVWWPLYHGEFDLLSISFCNVCATSILISPIIFLLKNKYAKDGLFIIGTIGGYFSLVTPFYYEGLNAISFDFLRFFLCHTLLFITSLLPVLLGLHKLEVKRFWFVGIMFVLYEVLVFGDNVLIKYFKNGHDMTLAFETFYAENPLWVCHRPLANDALGRIFVSLKFDHLIYQGGYEDIPVIYSMIPLYLIISLISIIIFFVFSKLKKC